MDNVQFKAFLKGMDVKKPSRLPAEYDYAIDTKSKTLTLKLSHKGVCEDNMQDNGSAFESWAIAFKYYCPELIQRVVIDWEEPANESEHFNRFIYRLTRFVQTYDWATAYKHIPAMPSLLCCSAPNGDTKTKEHYSMDSEDWLECDFIERNESKYDYINHQLPVGLFDGEASDYSPFTPAGNSQIDIWALKKDEFSIFELKIPSNKPLGIISELMFYTNVICDLLHHNILIDEKKASIALENNYRGFNKFYDIYSGKIAISKINAVFLAENLHSSFSEDFLDIINDSTRLKRYNITYSIVKP